jgi:hypothetical protein
VRLVEYVLIRSRYAYSYQRVEDAYMYGRVCKRKDRRPSALTRLVWSQLWESPSPLLAHRCVARHKPYRLPWTPKQAHPLLVLAQSPTFLAPTGSPPVRVARSTRRTIEESASTPASPRPSLVRSTNILQAGLTSASGHLRE